MMLCMKKIKKTRSQIILPNTVRTKAKKIGRKVSGKYEITAGVIAAVEAFELK